MSSDTTFTIPENPPAPAQQVTFSDATGSDPDAPYGRFANGKARKRPVKAGAGGAKSTTTAPPVGAPRVSTVPPKKKGAPVDFRPVVEDALSVVSLALVALGRKDRAFLADAATLQMVAKEGASVANDMAQINPAIARALSVSAPAVPYLRAANFVFGLGVQLAANHGVPLPGPLAGRVIDPNQLAAGMEDQMRQAAAAAEADAKDQAVADAWAAEQMTNVAERQDAERAAQFAGV